MKKVITTERIPIKLWIDGVEDTAMEQAKNLANLPFACKHIVLLPDCHSGYGMPIGSVLATKGVVVPNSVGKDISCGVIACKTNKLVKEIDLDVLKKIMGQIRNVIPIGLNGKHKDPCDVNLMPELWSGAGNHHIVVKELINARKSLGSLGSGNHFLELQKDTEEYLWVMIHSGSRNLGSKVADHYNNIAKELNKKYYSTVDTKQDLAFLPTDTIEAREYFNEMKYCIKFAYLNRQQMLIKTQDVMTSVLPGIGFELPINVAHNYAVYEHHFGENFIIHRKGAISAKKDEIGIIPGSQGTKSYIVRGLGNPDSFTSCSHGAGRVMGRKDAIRRLNLVDEIKILDDQGIIHGIRNQEDLDEAPSSYKNIETVMKNQEDLVEIVTELSPIAVIKG